MGRLSDYCDIGSSKRIFAGEYQIKGIPFYRGEEISELSKGNRNPDSKFISYERYEQLKEKYYIPRINDLLITAVGTIGNMWMVDKEEPFYFKDGNIIMIYNYKSELYPKYLYYLLQTEYATTYIHNSALNSVQKALTIKMLSEMPINLPCYSEQIKSVEKLVIIDSIINNNNAIILQLKEMLRVSYSYWFHQFDFPDENGNPYKSSGGKMVWNDQLKRKIPEGWEAVNLIDLFNYQNGVEPSSKKYISNPKDMTDLIKFYRVGDVDKSSNVFVKTNEFSSNCEFGDILVSFDGAIGKMAYTFSGLYSSGFKKITSDSFSALIPYVIYTDVNILKKLTLSSSSGSILKHAFSYVKYEYIPYNEYIFKLFDTKFQNVFNLVLVYERLIQLLNGYKEFLLPFILTGFPRE